MLWATSDLHGYDLSAFQRFLKSSGFQTGDHLYIIGDVIDRNGDGGVEMLEWILNTDWVTLIMGNHEAMMLECSFLFARPMSMEELGELDPEQEAQLMRWFQNGSAVTIDSLMNMRLNRPRMFERIQDMVREAPLYMEVETEERKLFLVHGGLDRFSPDRAPDSYSLRELVWTRPEVTDRYWEDRLVILGHTPTRYYGEHGQMFRTDTWLDIDTGAAGGGHPMLLRLDDLKPFYVDNKDL